MDVREKKEKEKKLRPSPVISHIICYQKKKKKVKKEGTEYTTK
jgi:hypothetical protein